LNLLSFKREIAMSEDINSERKKLYEKSAEYLELFIKNIPSDAEKVFYSRQIFKKIDAYVRDDYMSDRKLDIDNNLKSGSHSSETLHLLAQDKKIQDENNKFN
jgi:benzoyl-CoA reductase/2-hydroxyglutaryl-CoA dehydratase subunit BcrC/BadD/HgdB